ncbi:precorrin-3B synthase [Mesorhizobium sp. BAC0120]|uniref:precorrin-3B synthase n=1 Tax=Mesorhizobium sp. BAC0120 TaxID=3090670 RepID=UPI00298C46D2|nr:precorrin-3B synthase [Mesorhizobium sp. BAC0120]MDW6020547.1 precorrin-3B synthase [Mesorhizobium sp. BAC0120]
MNALLRRGLCPTLAAPMQTGDGLLTRLNPVASGLSPKALIALSEAAQRHGNGITEVTARGSLQIRGLTAKSAAQLAAEVDALGIEVRGGVPVETGPLAGLDPEEIADPRPLAARIRAGIAGAGLEARLGPKVSVVVDGGGRSGLDEVAGDVRLTRCGVAWELAVAGDAATATHLGEFEQDTACDAALAILSEIAALGREGRARNLSPEILREIIVKVRRSTAPPSVLPDISPTRGEIALSSRILPIANAAGDAASSKRPISPPVGEMSGRTEGGAVERKHRNHYVAPAGILALTNGQFALPAALPFGHLHAAQLIAFITRAESLGATEIRLAPRRTLILLCPSESSANAIRDAARQATLIIDPGDPRSRMAACPGAPACASGHIPARAIAADVAPALPSGFDLHVSGCAKRCARPGHAGLTLLGLDDGAGLVVEAWGKQPIASVAKKDTVAAFRRVAALIAAERQSREGETACLNRLGASRLANAFVGSEADAFVTKEPVETRR